MVLLKGTTDKVTTEGLIEKREGSTEEKKEEEENITREELIKHLKMLKKSIRTEWYKEQSTETYAKGDS